MDLESKFGLTIHFMKDNGRMTNQMDKEDLFIQMEICMMEDGKKAKNMVRANIKVVVDQLTMDNGKMIKNMDTELKKDKMGHNMKGNYLVIVVNFIKIIGTGMGKRFLKMIHTFKANLKMICMSKEKERNFYPMEKSMKDNSKEQLCMVMECLNQKMAKYLKEFSLKEREKVQEK